MSDNIIIKDFKSKQLKELSFNEDTKILQVTFNNDNVYQYFDVPLEVFGGLASSESKGSYLAEKIKGAYRYANVTPGKN